MKKLFICIGAISLMISSSVFAKYESQQEINKQNAIAFCDTLVNQKDFDKAREYIGEHYKQHNPNIEDDVDGLKKYFEIHKVLYPNMHVDFARAAAEDNYVYVHMHLVLIPNTNGLAVIDIFRFDNGKIVEHWDAVEEVPAHSKNNNGMF